jgi:hypothetical protein
MHARTAVTATPTALLKRGNAVAGHVSLAVSSADAQFYHDFDCKVLQ